MTRLYRFFRARADGVGQDHGFTLVELLLALVIGAIILTGLTQALIVSQTTSGSTTLRINQAQDEQFSARWFASDVASLNSAPTTAATSTPCNSGSTTVLILPRAGSGNDVTWTLSAISGSSPLVCNLARQVGSNTPLIVARNVVAVSAPTCTPAACGSATQTISVTVTELLDPRDSTTAHQLKFAMYGAVRQQSNTTPGGTPASLVLPAVLTLPGASCSGTGIHLNGGGHAGGVFSIGDGQTVVVNTCIDEKGNHDTVQTNGGTVYVPSGQSGGQSGTTPLTSTVPDPLAGLPDPTSSPTYSGSTYQGPGTYTSAVTIPTGTTLASGIYVFKNGVTFNGTVHSAAGGVLITLACTNCSANFSANTTLTGLTGSSSGSYCGMVLFQDHGNSQGLDLSSETLNGLVYLPDGSISGNGNAGTGATIAQAVVSDIDLGGNGNVTVTGPISGC